MLTPPRDRTARAPLSRWLSVSPFTQVACLCAAIALPFIFPNTAHAAGQLDTGGAATAHGLDPLVLVGVAVMLVVAKLCGELFERKGQPAVLGELIGGMLLAALALAGVGAFELLKTDAVIDALAEIGVIVLLFEVGLESDLAELLKVGHTAMLVAAAGTAASFALGWGAAQLCLPEAPRLTQLFVGAAITATSVGARSSRHRATPDADGAHDPRGGDHR